jgi:nicotinate phosphoribosyltransferase
MSFSKEKEAFRAIFETFPEKCTLLVDTYDTKEGISNAIRVAKEFRAKGHLLKSIRLDSGNILKYSKMARAMFDAEDFREVRVLASGDLDEYRIAQLIAEGAAVDDFGVGTKMGVSADAPSVDAIYKIAEVANEAGVFLPTMKLSEGKVTLPGRKQVFRIFDKRGLIKKDFIGLEKENLGEPLLKRVMQAGEVLCAPVSLATVRETAARNLHTLGKELRNLEGSHPPPVAISPGLAKMIKSLTCEIKKRQSRVFKKS